MAIFKRKEAEPFRVLNGQLSCRMCGHDKFWRRRAQLNTALATFFDFDWANRTATCMVCERCGYIHWFLQQ